ncbi:hypothetical protein BKA70DRAFT_1247595 [Coprinopsis sp. MPI-PUGE-AT-0042]|nr:hypothetical protein BKA70DRAFT_1247595 [Coprinopsis sp. MPI-PUGE-AT-0042]
MMLARRLLPSARASRIPPSQVLLHPSRSFATKPPTSKPPAPGGGAAIQHTISNSAAEALTATGRFFKWTLIAAAGLGITVATAVEGAHQYVEHWAMGPEKDEDVKKYEWDLAGEHFHGDPQAGGTDPGLGFLGRHALRSAWHVQHWGLGSSDLYATTAKDSAMRPTTDFVAFEASQFLKIAIGIAEQRVPHLHPNTLAELVSRYSSTLERLGDDYSALAFASYHRAWEGYSRSGIPSARMALRMGDISLRLGQDGEAQKWWGTAIRTCQGSSPSDVGPLLEPTTLPNSPWAQRIIASTLVSISAHYAQSGRLKDAEAFEESALNYLRSIPTPPSLSAASPPQALHSLFLLQRSSLISIHLAEVMHVRKKPVISSIQWLTAAAESSERVARALTGLPLQIQGTFGGLDVPGEDTKILPAYSSSRSMDGVASRLYTDAKRTSAEAWNLLGVLYEQKEGKSSKTALQCYERAAQWSGKLVRDQVAS